MTDKQIINSCEFQSRCIQYKDMYSNKHIKCPIVDFALACRGENKCKYKTVYEQLKAKEQECEELKKQLMQKSEVDTFFNTPIEGWSNDPCGICPHKAENEELKKEIINKNEKIKELRFSVSDLTNRLCYLNAEKSFRIVDLEQTLDGIEKELKEDIYCENQECGCDDFEECLKCTKEHILDIINKAKGR